MESSSARNFMCQIRLIGVMVNFHIKCVSGDLLGVGEKGQNGYQKAKMDPWIFNDVVQPYTSCSSALRGYFYVRKAKFHFKPGRNWQRKREEIIIV